MTALASAPAEAQTLTISASGDCAGTPANCGTSGDRDTTWPGLQVDEGDTVTFRMEVSPASGSPRFTFSLIGTGATSADLGQIRATGSNSFNVSGIPNQAGFNLFPAGGYVQNVVIPVSTDSATEPDESLTGRIDSFLDGVTLQTYPLPSPSSVTVTVRGADSAPSFGSGSVSSKTFTAGAAIVEFTVPAASGGNGGITYAASGLPDGLIFDATGTDTNGCPGTEARKVCGTPTTAAAAQTVTITATDADSNTMNTDRATLTFSVTVNADATLASSPTIPHGGQPQRRHPHRHPAQRLHLRRRRIDHELRSRHQPGHRRPLHQHRHQRRDGNHRGHTDLGRRHRLRLQRRGRPRGEGAGRGALRFRRPHHRNAAGGAGCAAGRHRLPHQPVAQRGSGRGRRQPRDVHGGPRQSPGRLRRRRGRFRGQRQPGRDAGAHRAHLHRHDVVTVTAEQDDDGETESVTLRHSVSTACDAAGYPATLAIPSVQVTVADDDAPPPPNQPPVAAGAFGDVDLDPGGSVEVSLPGKFRDPEGGPLTYTAESLNPEVAGATVSNGRLWVDGRSPGLATVFVTAADSGGLRARLAFKVRVGRVLSFVRGSASAPEGGVARLALELNSPSERAAVVGWVL